MATQTTIVGGNDISREQAKQRALAIVDYLIRTEGGNSIMVCSRWGKWTKNDIRDAIVNDRELHNGKRYIKGTNPIDDLWLKLRLAGGGRIFKG